MKKLHYSLLLLLFPVYLHAQISDQYRDMVKKAETYYNNKQYKESADMYIAALNSGSRMAMVSDIYSASCAMARAGMADSAFYRLNMIARSGSLNDYENLKSDSDLISLHNDARWNALCNKVKENKDKKR